MANPLSPDQITAAVRERDARRRRFWKLPKAALFTEPKEPERKPEKDGDGA
jgi:hypothetical protein